MPGTELFLRSQNIPVMGKIFPAFYGTRRFIAVLRRARLPVPILSHIDPVHAFLSSLVPIHLKRRKCVNKQKHK